MRTVRIPVVTLCMVRESVSNYRGERVLTPGDAARLWHEFQKRRGEPDREQFWVLCLDSRKQPTTLHMVSQGTLNNALVHPREAFKVAILANADSVVFFHNHPSGNAEASDDDKKITTQLVAAGKILGIEVSDHIISGQDRWASMRVLGML